MAINKIITLLIFCCVISLSYNNLYASSETGGKEQTALNLKIETKDLTGVNLWIAELYNNDRVLYAIVVTLVMATLGSIMAFGTDLVLRYFGMNVSKISHRE